MACDVPAARKVAGFLSHAARLGCSKCLKEFPKVKEGDVYKTDYSGFDRETWPPRTNKRHRENANKTQKPKTPKQRTELESALGARYSELYRLSYFDCIWFTVIDPMHNLLGTGKQVFKNLERSKDSFSRKSSENPRIY